MSTLLVSLGTSPAIVPEAFLLPGAYFEAVHVLTTAGTQVDFVLEWFAARAPETRLTITRVAGFNDFTSEADHFHFEEVLYRWWLLHAGDTPPYVCLSGGFKTMSAAVQKAAAVFGAIEVFHVICNLAGPQQPKTADEIEKAHNDGLLHWIRLGGEPGWPQVRGLEAVAYPLHETIDDGSSVSVRAPDFTFRDHLHSLIERSHRIAGAWEEISSLPFATLATWSKGDLTWLGEPLDPVKDRNWVAALPKVELHCHLGGFATDGAALEKVRAAAADPASLPEPVRIPEIQDWPLPRAAVPLVDYMKRGDANGSRLLTDPGCLRRQCELLYEHLRAEKIVYAEVRCSPGNYASHGRSPWTILCEIKNTFDNCAREAGAVTGSDAPCINLIIIATRRENGDYRAAISRHLALATSAAGHWTSPDECRVVGVDLAGYENKETRAHYFREEFTGIHRCGLALTVHAGENDEAEGIWRAVFDLNARRLGHALNLINSPELLQSVADRGIGVEMCPYANVQIKGFPLDPATNKPGNYPLKQYLEAGVKVTVNTDNIGISDASLTDNLLLAGRLCPSLTRLDLLRMLRNGIDLAFLPPVQREEFRSLIENLIPKR